MITRCSECGELFGAHTSWCLTKGYTSVGPHPNAPKPSAAPMPDPTPCPCGIARLDCDYHRPEPATERTWEVYDAFWQSVAYLRPAGFLEVDTEFGTAFWSIYAGENVDFLRWDSSDLCTCTFSKPGKVRVATAEAVLW